MDLQTVIVVMVVLASLAYAAVVFFRKTRAFSVKSACDDDCGCGGKDTKTSKATRIAH